MSRSLAGLAVLATLVLAGCGGDEGGAPADDAVPAPDEGSLRVVRALECCYVEGSFAGLRVTGSDGEVTERELDPGRLTQELVTLRLPAGRYRVETWEVPCEGNCGQRDPPTARCASDVDVAGGAAVELRVRVLPGAGCRHDAGPATGSAWPSTLVRIDGVTGRIVEETPIDADAPQLIGVAAGAPVLLEERGGTRLLFGTEVELLGALVAGDAIAGFRPHEAVIGLDAAGSERWRHPTGESGPAAAGGLVLAQDRFEQSGEGEVAALDPATGAVRWRAPGVALMVFAHDGRIWLRERADAQASWLAYDAATGAPAGRLRLAGDLAATSSTPVSAGGLLTLVSSDAEGRTAAVGLDPATGEERWRTDLDGYPLSEPVAAGPTIVLTTMHGLIALDGASGEVRWRLPARWAIDERLIGTVADGGDVLALRR